MYLDGFVEKKRQQLVERHIGNMPVDRPVCKLSQHGRRQQTCQWRMRLWGLMGYTFGMAEMSESCCKFGTDSLCIDTLFRISIPLECGQRMGGCQRKRGREGILRLGVYFCGSLTGKIKQ